MKALPDGSLWCAMGSNAEGVALSFDLLIAICCISPMGLEWMARPRSPANTALRRSVSQSRYTWRITCRLRQFLCIWGMSRSECGYSGSQVPWVKDAHDRMKAMTVDDFRVYAAAGTQGGAAPRWNGSLLYPAKVPDLIGLKDRKYLDATATHQHRGIGDLMRYAALVSYAEAIEVGPYHVLPPDAQRLGARVPDEVLYALALYIYSLKPPQNPNPVDEKAKAGQKVFAREGCSGCHTPPLYTSNKITLAEGFQPPEDKPANLDLLPISVGTDPGLALKTRKGTGYCKVPSLKGASYRGHYLHDGAAASLEEMFDPDRLFATHVPGGFSPPGAVTRAIRGHEFGLKLTALEREQLIAFLRTL